MVKLVDLSHPLEDGQLSYPGDPEMHVTAHRTLESDGVNVSSIAMGTHLDAPLHFFADGASLDEIPLDRFYGPARLVDLAPGGELEPKRALTVEMFREHADAFRPGAKVIYRTGWDRVFGRPEFFTDLPSLTLDRREGDRAVGHGYPYAKQDRRTRVPLRSVEAGRGDCDRGGSGQPGPTARAVHLHRLPPEFPGPRRFTHPRGGGY